MNGDLLKTINIHQSLWENAACLINMHDSALNFYLLCNPENLAAKILGLFGK